jgi:hypothetical protein
MKKMKKMKKMKNITAVFSFVLGISLISFGMFTLQTGEMGRRWNIVGAADADPGAGSSGIINVFIYPHSANPGADYATNLTEGNAYAHFPTPGGLNRALEGDVPYDTEFDIIVLARFNTTHAYNSSGSTWETSWTRANMTCADLGIGALTAMTGVQTATSGDYMWVQFYLNNAGSGYTITHGASVNVTALVVQAYF